jgi:hypothetical protein
LPQPRFQHDGGAIISAAARREIQENEAKDRALDKRIQKEVDRENALEGLSK